MNRIIGDDSFGNYQWLNFKLAPGQVVFYPRPVFGLPHGIAVQTRITKFGPEVQNNLVKTLLFLICFVLFFIFVLFCFIFIFNLYLFIYLFHLILWGGGGGSTLIFKAKSNSKVRFYPSWAWSCPQDNSSPIQSKIAKFGPDVQTTLFKLRSVLGSDHH